MNPSKLDTLDEHPVEEGMEVHPAITLLIARMESHPKEFYKNDPNRKGSYNMPNPSKTGVALGQVVEHTKSLWNRKEKRLFNLALRKVRLEEAHTRMMDTLLGS